MPSYQLTLTMLSPVHIGTGQEIEPTEYVVRQDDRGIFFDAIDFSRFLADLTDADRSEFNRAADQGSTTFLRKFVADKMNPDRHVRWTANANDELLVLYEKGLEDDSSKLCVHPMIRDARSGNAYLPGSSIKGALRTAWVSHKAATYRGRERLHRLRRDFEPEVLGYMNSQRHRPEIRADPFRAMRIRDAMLPESSNAVDPVQIRRRVGKRGASDPGKIQMFYDTTFSQLDNEEIEAHTMLTIDNRLANTKNPDRKWNFRYCVAEPIDIEELMDACKDFYKPKLDSDYNAFFKGNPDLEETGNKLNDLASKLSDNQALIRLGRFSHFECVTVDRYRKRSRPGAGSTRTLSAGVLPMGWVKLTFEQA
jgi:CRISPR-associated protein Csm5